MEMSCQKEKEKTEKGAVFIYYHVYVNFEGETKLLTIPIRSQNLCKSRWLNYRSFFFF